MKIECTTQELKELMQNVNTEKKESAEKFIDRLIDIKIDGEQLARQITPSISKKLAEQL